MSIYELRLCSIDYHMHTLEFKLFNLFIFAHVEERKNIYNIL